MAKETLMKERESKTDIAYRLMLKKKKERNFYELWEDVKVELAKVAAPEELENIEVIQKTKQARSNKIFGILNGKKVPQIGNITMDQMMFDITGIEASEGDVITLIGDDISINDWASILGTINYELICRLKARLSRVYTR